MFSHVRASFVLLSRRALALVARYLHARHPLKPSRRRPLGRPAKPTTSHTCQVGRLKGQSPDLPGTSCTYYRRLYKDKRESARARARRMCISRVGTCATEPMPAQPLLGSPARQKSTIKGGQQKSVGQQTVESSRSHKTPAKASLRANQFSKFFSLLLAEHPKTR